MDIASKTPAQQTVLVAIQKAPGLAAMTPAANARDVHVDTRLSIQLQAPNRNLRWFELQSSDIPLTSTKPQATNDEVFSWSVRGQLEQGKTYTAEVLDRNQPLGAQHFATFSFSTASEPVPSSDARVLHPGDPIVVNFDQPMVQSAGVLKFAMPGEGAWASETQYRFTGGSVKPGTAYNFTVVKGSKSKAGGFVAADKSFPVETPGHVTVVGSQPSGGRIALNTAVKITFDQPVDKASAQSAFSISPATNGSFSWSGNTMIFTPAGYGYQTTYTYAIAAGVTPIFGLPGTAYSNSFSTVYEIRKLTVPSYRQVYSLSCEAASLRMALAYYGVNTSDDDILSRIGYAPKPRDTATNTWQDPNVEFVGEVNGKMNVTGWGVYAGPVAKAARSFGRSADVVYGPSTSTVASAIYAGRPVVVWGVMGMSAVDDSWNTTTSGVVHAAKNQHVRVAYGVEGSPDAPVGFYLMDPIRGSVYISAGALQASILGGGNQVLIVY